MMKSQGINMKQWGLPPSQETYLTLACGYAKQGDLQGVEKVMSECQAQGVGFDDWDFLELVFVMSEAGHKEHIAKNMCLGKNEKSLAWFYILTV